MSVGRDTVNLFSFTMSGRGEDTQHQTTECKRRRCSMLNNGVAGEMILNTEQRSGMETMILNMKEWISRGDATKNKGLAQQTIFNIKQRRGIGDDAQY